MCGAMLAAASRSMLMLVDGFCASAAMLSASRMAPHVLDYAIFSHLSSEYAHKRMLDELSARPLLNLGLRLGEGTGAALAFPLVAAACAFLNEMASFSSAGVSRRDG